MNLSSLFEVSVSRYPHRVALEFPDHFLTYRELAEASAQVVHQLDEVGAAAGVGVLADWSAASYIAYLGVLRSGRAALPMSPDAPLERISRIAESAGIKQCLVSVPSSGTGASAVLEDAGIAPLEVTDGQSDGLPHVPYIPRQSPDIAATRPDAEPIAYILSTSGSTGIPKSVPIRHRNVAAFLAGIRPFIVSTPDSRFSQTFDLTFDPSVYDLFAAWSSGAAVVVPTRTERLSPREYVHRRELTHWCSVPSAIALLGSKSMDTDSLIFSAFIGEPLLYADVASWIAAMPRTRVANIYGPTELTVACTAYLLPEDSRTWTPTPNETVPIGHPFPGQEILVIGPDGRPTARGELCVRGDQRFDGYALPEDNIGRFMTQNPDGTYRPTATSEVGPNDWYRTGDLVESSQSDGMLHLGRVDRQVKVRGYRVELEEVEGTLRRSGLFDAVCVVSVPGRHGLTELGIAYLGAEVANGDVVDAAASLPTYMRPTKLLRLESFPMTPNRKLDYDAVVNMIGAAGARIRYR